MNSAKLIRLDQVKEQVRSHLVDYVAKFRKVVTNKNFSCLNPAHPDKDPSMGIVPGNPELAHCFGCGVTCDIFTAAHFLEGRPLRGPGFLTDNLFYLAQQFGIDTPIIELTEDEQFDADTYRAYNIAADLIATSPVHQLVLDKLSEYGWSEATQRALGIGSVESFQTFVSTLVDVYGFDRQFLNDVDLDNPNIFHPNNLIFTVRDENGQAVGFAARNLDYDAARANYDQAVLSFGKDSEQARALKILVPSKFVNSAAQVVGPENLVIDRNHIYQKKRRLFGLHLARRHAPPLYIFEGYSDGATSYDRGLLNACAIGATSFTPEHLEVLLGLGIEHMIFVLDADEAGTRGTERFVSIVEEHLGSRVGLKIEIVVLPDGADDPDRFIREHGLGEFLALPKLDVFAWHLHQAIAKGESPDHVFEKNVPLIINEPNTLRRFRMAESLASATGIDSRIIYSEVERRSDVEGQKLRQEMLLVSESTAKLLQKSPERIVQILRESQDRVERLSRSQHNKDTKSLVEYFDGLTDEAENNFDPGGLLTGYPLFDSLFGGMPRKECFLTIPGKPNHGKSSFGCNLAGKMISLHDDLVFLIHTIDDSLGKFYTRLLGSRYRVPSRYFEAAGYHIKANTQVRVNGGDYVPFGDVYHEAKKWLRDQMVQERLLPFDAVQMENSLATLDWKLGELRKRYASSPIICFADNFHKYQLPGDGEASDVRNASAQCQMMTNKHRITLLATMELPKQVLAAGMRPRVANIKGSGGISYDSTANMGVYNDKKDMREKAVLVWEEKLDQPEEVAPGRYVHVKRQPILEMVFDKSKVHKGFDGEIYYEFDPDSGQLVELDYRSQQQCRHLVIEQAIEMAEARKRRGGGGAGGGSQFSSSYSA